MALPTQPDATDFVDEQSLVNKWMTDSDVQTWWDDYDQTPGVEAWTDLRPTGARRNRDTPVPGAASITQQDVEQSDVQAREGGAGVVETPKIKGDWLDIAKSQVGSPYVWADSNPIGEGGGPGTGFDCSGFTAWVYSSAFGIALPHLSEGQRQGTKSVSRKNLRPGDLIFYHYSDRNGAGAADHVEIYIGNGKAIGTPDPDGTVGVQTVDWGAFIGGGRVEGVDALRATPKESAEHRQGRKPGGEEQFNVSLVPASMGTKPNLADVQVGLLMDGGRESGRKDKSTPEFPEFGNGQVKAQLYRGFMDAGRPDLAKMVKTKDFDAWIKAEGGWDPSHVSDYFAGHGRNAGLFQFAFLDRDWVTQDVSHSGGEWTYAATPYEQARMVVKYFDLSPGDIRTYADQVRSHTYHGWG